MNLKLIRDMVKQKYISVQTHPENTDLKIYNYTQKAQFDKVWNEATLMCRGLILWEGGSKPQVIARPFVKFFNLEEMETVPNEPFEVFDKLDGSLGILYRFEGESYLATRGSFTSDQAIMGNYILKHQYAGIEFDRDYTYLFEIVYPGNRIVVDYGKTKDLFLLAMIHTESGQELSYVQMVERHGHELKIVKRFDGLINIVEIRDRFQYNNTEGFVIRYASGLRVKIKFDEYVRLHRLITGVNKRRIWDMLRNNQDMSELLERVPEEFEAWVKQTAYSLQLEHAKIVAIVIEDLQAIKQDLMVNNYEPIEIKTTHRKEFAKRAVLTKYPGILFAMLDGKEYNSKVWAMLRPAHEVPFKIEI